MKTVVFNKKQTNKSDNNETSSSPTQNKLNDDSLIEILKKQNDITLLLAQNQARSSLPHAEPEIFSGEDPINYKSFKLSFERAIGTKTQGYADLYCYLVKYTSGEAQNIVKSYNCGNVELAYKNAFKQLDQKYGNQYSVANHYLSKLEVWPIMKKDDSVALRELSNFLQQCQSMMSGMSSMNQLNGPKEIRDIVKKLPFPMQRAFRDIATSKMEKEEPVLFEDLVRFVSHQSRVLNTPIFGELGKKPEKSSKKVFFSKSKQPCLCCKKNNHELNDCIYFNKKSQDEKRKFIKDKKICFGCMKSSDHSSKECKNRLSCTKCSGKHPTSLHIEHAPTSGNTNSPSSPAPAASSAVSKTPAKPSSPPASNDPGTASSSQPQQSGSSCHVKTHSSMSVKKPAVLVDIRFHGSNKTIRTYMGMDTYCDSVYLDAELVREAGIKPQDISFSLTTLQSVGQTNSFGKIKGFDIMSIDRTKKNTVNEAFVPKNWPFTIENSPSPSDSYGHPKLRNLNIKYENKKIGLLIGIQRSDIVQPLQTIPTSRRGPYATLHQFGWAINGPTGGIPRVGSSCFFVKKESSPTVDELVETVFSRDFQEVDEDENLSIEDHRWIKVADKSLIKLPNNHMQLDLPFKITDLRMPDNYNQAYSRLMKLKIKLNKDRDLYKGYCSFMQDMLDNDYAEVIPPEEIPSPTGKKWYLVHFHVVHKTKKKLRIVFDCSLKYDNISLNDVLLQGPDITNSLVGVLLRFREQPIAFSADIRSMYYQVRVPKEHTEYLRFLWFPNGNLEENPVPHRLKVHVFGAKSSPSCASYALRQSAQLSPYPDKIINVVLKAFYVDDVLKSESSLEDAIDVMKNLILMLEENGFDLTGFMSNSRELLHSIPSNKLSKELKELNLSTDELPKERTLGLVWIPESDNFGCRLKIEEHPCTKRGILQTLFSVYDPLFLVSPAIIPGKKIFQEACSVKLGWDDELPGDLSRRWKRWKTELPKLQNFEIPRCYLPNQFVCNVQLHLFCDGSMIAYGSVAYLRLQTNEGRIHTSLVMSCARMTPVNRNALKTVPRIELNSAKLSIILQERIVKELNFKISNITYWTDSETTLRYIRSESGRFHTFVANRISYIRSKSDPAQWRHVPGKMNPSDMLSRGTSVDSFLKNQLWCFGPLFLQPEEDWPKQEATYAKTIPN